MRKTDLDHLLSRTLLVFERAVPRDTVPARAPDPKIPRPVAPRHPIDQNTASAAEDLRTLCEALVTHTPADAVADFLTDQVPEPRSAMILACVLQLTDTDDGARFWWQYAAACRARGGRLLSLPPPPRPRRDPRCPLVAQADRRHPRGEDRPHHSPPRQQNRRSLPRRGDLRRHPPATPAPPGQTHPPAPVRRRRRTDGLHAHCRRRRLPP